ncbi:MAG: M42 family peptidase, partial [Elusimicrobiota bacterium]|nr:M42 family peptidase [Elusimicrobiota bacterium]
MDKLLESLLLSDGISGYEENASKITKSALEKCCDKVEIDNLGNVIAKKGNGKKSIMIAAHIDEIGMAVK